MGDGGKTIRVQRWRKNGEVRRSESNNGGKINGRCLGRFSVALAKWERGSCGEGGGISHTLEKGWCRSSNGG